ncbi:hypothetical protein CC85DRAFT_287372 [Cutaneotrichosporon oleaginosum]|uniref:Phospholipase A2 domain-containing protein n=1 Tax=Cutaneotrichosporon oleaginosum TaxID=879819 RepID=A0A0J0XHF9_9TREE|nr:uncharacterized protein CC85DRAFT_287372 [Cutaneotrichosporon oleaginosum]KLT40531.1 hypothetical protein CC85DRAFT_287372 [Cutaneotrichosporon oleaginosum]TXT08398.1 hypothetical protein COLE_05322 [Cutaneotrichosporon oleaginosum]
MLTLALLPLLLGALAAPTEQQLAKRNERCANGIPVPKDGGIIRSQCHYNGPSWAGEMHPDAAARIHHACEEHARCYADCRSPRTECDVRLLIDTFASCNLQPGTFEATEANAASVWIRGNYQCDFHEIIAPQITQANFEAMNARHCTCVQV